MTRIGCFCLSIVVSLPVTWPTVVAAQAQWKAGSGSSYVPPQPPERRPFVPKTYVPPVTYTPSPSGRAAWPTEGARRPAGAIRQGEDDLDWACAKGIIMFCNRAGNRYYGEGLTTNDVKPLQLALRHFQKGCMGGSADAANCCEGVKKTKRLIEQLSAVEAKTPLESAPAAVPVTRVQEAPCIRADATVRTVGGRYEIKGEVVADRKTHLTWQRARGCKMLGYADASKYCEDLTIGGYSDWRLPTISELKTLIVGCPKTTSACKVSDSCLLGREGAGCYSGATCQSCSFNKGPGEDGFYRQREVWLGGKASDWSSSGLSDRPGDRWQVDFTSGSVLYYPGANFGDVRCVRK
jgi:hypothetical protein